MAFERPWRAGIKDEAARNDGIGIMKLEGGKMRMNLATAPGGFQAGSNQSQAAGEKHDMRHDALFERVSARLKAQVGPDVFASWFGRLKLHSVSKSVVRLSVPTTFLKSWINNRYLDLITTLVQQEDSEILKVEILVRTATRGHRPTAPEESVAAAAEAAVVPPSRRSAAPTV
ncbi:DnaA N-terminal domain-containing protein, partial [Sinorhizobium meliloti]